MKIKYLFFAFVTMIFILPNICTMAEAYFEYLPAYIPGDTVHITYNPNINIASKPKFVRYTLFDPSNNVVYEEDHPLTYVKQIAPLIPLYAWHDEYDIRIPAFAKPGMWRVEGRLHSEFLWVIDLPDLCPLKEGFKVEETNFLQNLFAPWYFTYDGGLMVGRVSGSLPVHPLLIIIIIGILMAIFFVIRYILKKSKGGK